MLRLAAFPFTQSRASNIIFPDFSRSIDLKALSRNYKAFLLIRGCKRPGNSPKVVSLNVGHLGNARNQFPRSVWTAADPPARPPPKSLLRPAFEPFRYTSRRISPFSDPLYDDRVQQSSVGDRGRVVRENLVWKGRGELESPRETTGCRPGRKTEKDFSTKVQDFEVKWAMTHAATNERMSPTVCVWLNLATSLGNRDKHALGLLLRENLIKDNIENHFVPSASRI